MSKNMNQLVLRAKGEVQEIQQEMDQLEESVNMFQKQMKARVRSLTDTIHYISLEMDREQHSVDSPASSTVRSESQTEQSDDRETNTTDEFQKEMADALLRETNNTRQVLYQVQRRPLPLQYYNSKQISPVEEGETWDTITGLIGVAVTMDTSGSTPSSAALGDALIQASDVLNTYSRMLSAIKVSILHPRHKGGYSPISVWRASLFPELHPLAEDATQQLERSILLRRYISKWRLSSMLPLILHRWYRWTHRRRRRRLGSLRIFLRCWYNVTKQNGKKRQIIAREASRLKNERMLRNILQSLVKMVRGRKEAEEWVKSERDTRVLSSALFDWRTETKQCILHRKTKLVADLSFRKKTLLNFFSKWKMMYQDNPRHQPLQRYYIYRRTWKRWREMFELSMVDRLRKRWLALRGIQGLKNWKEYMHDQLNDAGEYHDMRTVSVFLFQWRKYIRYRRYVKKTELDIIQRRILSLKANVFHVWTSTWTESLSHEAMEVGILHRRACRMLRYWKEFSQNRIQSIRKIWLRGYFNHLQKLVQQRKRLWSDANKMRKDHLLKAIMFEWYDSLRQKRYGLAQRHWRVWRYVMWERKKKNELAETHFRSHTLQKIWKALKEYRDFSMNQYVLRLYIRRWRSKQYQIQEQNILDSHCADKQFEYNLKKRALKALIDILKQGNSSSEFNQDSNIIENESHLNGDDEKLSQEEQMEQMSEISLSSPHIDIDRDQKRENMQLNMSSLAIPSRIRERNRSTRSMSSLSFSSNESEASDYSSPSSLVSPSPRRTHRLLEQTNAYLRAATTMYDVEDADPESACCRLPATEQLTVLIARMFAAILYDKTRPRGMLTTSRYTPLDIIRGVFKSEEWIRDQSLLSGTEQERALQGVYILLIRNQLSECLSQLLGEENEEFLENHYELAAVLRSPKVRVDVRRTLDQLKKIFFVINDECDMVENILPTVIKGTIWSSGIDQLSFAIDNMVIHIESIMMSKKLEDAILNHIVRERLIRGLFNILCEGMIGSLFRWPHPIDWIIDVLHYSSGGQDHNDQERTSLASEMSTLLREMQGKVYGSGNETSNPRDVLFMLWWTAAFNKQQGAKYIKYLLDAEKKLTAWYESKAAIRNTHIQETVHKLLLRISEHMLSVPTTLSDVVYKNIPDDPYIV
eukprot:gb/GECH01004008.1/.p1 GENE.gb/GECH01004008.1/~~gb/GECH01004008.1/.p1  ORF type:complete len:1153 (+),score=186.97 gb/GECH01004008.1/:1-3459(+)